MCEEQTVSLVDVLEEDEELEEEASAVLAGSDSDHCSYPQGYVKRQALYACSTCTPKGGEAAGVCLACSYKCHEGHDLFELYTKRNFRCDCGNRKFPELQCHLHPVKDDNNSLNKYSHNFFGLYCTCSRPYPDPQDQVEDEMIQCVVCEDWLHGRHLGRAAPDCVELQEMICESCMNKHPFLWTYAAHLAVAGAAAQVKEETGGNSNSVQNKQEQVDDVIEPSSKRSREGAEPLREGAEPRSREGAEPLREGAEPRSREGAEPLREGAEPQREGAEPRSREGAEPRSREGAEPRSREGAEPLREGAEPRSEGAEPRSHEGAEPSCRLKELQAIGRSTVQSGAVFWPSSWRSRLCCCSACKDRLSESGLCFLLDDSDTVVAYETRGKNNEQQHEGRDGRDGRDPLMSALDNLNRVQQLEIIHGYNDMKTELKDFLQRFAAEGKVVTPDDIRQFFEQQQSRKRRRDDAFSCT